MSPPRTLPAFSRGRGWPLGLALLAAGCTAPAPSSLTNLETGKTYDGHVSVASPAAYSLELAAGEAAQLEVDQREVDLEVEIFGPHSGQPFSFDSPIDRKAPERVCFLAEASGRYTVVLSPFEKASGSYSLHLSARRTATAADRACAEAARLFMSAEQRRLDARPDAVLAADYEKAGRLWQEGGEPFFAAVATREAGNVELWLNRSTEAVESFRRALLLVRAAGHPSLEILLLNRLALALLDRGELGEAEQILLEALHKAQPAQLPEEEATTLNNLALVDETAGETHRAIERYREALSIWQTAGFPNQRAQTVKNLADAYGLLDHHDQALDLLEEALGLVRETGNLDRQAGILLSIGWTYYQRGKPGEAIEPIRKALGLWHQLGDGNGEAAALDRLGSVLRAAGDLPAAFDAYRRSLELSETAKSPKDAAATVANLGCLALERGQLGEALERLQSVRERYAKLTDPKAQAQVELCLAKTHRAMGALDTAIEHTEAALALVDALRETARRRGGRYRPIWLWQDYSELYVELLMARYRANGRESDLARAFEVGDLARARNLFELVLESQVGVRASAPEPLLERERALQHRLNAEETARRRLIEDSAKDTEIGAIERRLGALSLELEEARAAIRAADPRFAELAEPRPVSLVELQQRLDPRTAVLSYSLGAEHSFLLVVTGDGATAWDLASRARLETHARALYQAIRESRFDPGQAEHAARALAKLLLPADAIPPGVDRLMIVADGLLHYVPFAVLPSPRSDTMAPEERLLVDDFELQHLPSASVFAAIARRDAERAQAPKTLAVFADAVFSHEDERLLPRSGGAPATTDIERSGAIGVERLPAGPLPRLPATRTEALALLALVPAEQRLGVLGFDATKRAVLDADLERYRILHFATHALIDERFPDLSGLVLSRVDREGRPIDGDLYLHEIYGLRLSAELVVLSGCQTALGQQVRGDGMLSLTRGFLYAGSSRLLVSLWSVDDTATAVLMSELYAALLGRGESPAAALGAAQRLVRSDPRWRAPYFWAAFVLQSGGR